MKKTPKKYHKERDSVFYTLASRSKLARVLFTSERKLNALIEASDRYRTFTKPKKSGGTRLISAPRDDLKRLQSRIADLLQRIEPPDFLSAPVCGRSYVDNAAVHLGARAFRLLDIEDFFPSCTDNRVIWFFNKRMRCSIDVAVMLSKIATEAGCLPQGSPCSPILAYFSYVDMWEDIDRAVRNAGCRLTVYADDVTISGTVVPEEVVWTIKRTLYRFGHRYNVAKEKSRIDKPAEITGVIVSGNALLLPNRQHKSLHRARQDLKGIGSGTARRKLEQRLAGRKAQAEQVLKHGK